MDQKLQIQEAILSTLKVYQHDHPKGVPALILLGHAQDATRAKVKDIQEALQTLLGTSVLSVDGGEFYRLKKPWPAGHKPKPAKRPPLVAYPDADEPPQPRYTRCDHDFAGNDGDRGVDIHFELDHLKQVDPFF